MSGLQSLKDDAYQQLLDPLWRFLAPSRPAIPADSVFVFGGNDPAVPRHAAQLWKSGFATSVLVTGNSGQLTQHLAHPEAEIFRDIMVDNGVPLEAIVVEDQARNTGNNVSLGMLALQRTGVDAESLLLVAKPFIMRRCIATFALRFPSIVTIPSPPEGNILSFIDRPRDEFAIRLVEELDRLTDYVHKGFMAPVDVPADVRRVAERIRTKVNDE